jgi:amino acid adenylation domain-containing protein/thioester reductase-like protein
MGLPLQFNETPNPVLLKKAVECLREQHSALRLCIAEQNGEVFQHFSDFSAADNNYWQTVNASAWDDATLMEQVYQCLQQPFVLEQSVFRATLFAGGNSGCLLLLALHHIAGDATSLNILGQQLITVYESLLENGYSDPVINNDYGDYVQWEKSRLDSSVGKRMSNYWQKQLSGGVPILQLPTDFPRPAVQTFDGASIRFALSSDLSDSIKTLAKTKKTTPFSVLLSVYQLLLHRYSGQSAIWTAVPTSTPRTLPAFQQMVGYLVSPMIVKTDFNMVGETTFTQLLNDISKQVLSGLYNQPYPFTQLVKQLQPQYDPSYPPLVQTIFAVEQQELIARQFVAKTTGVVRRDIAQMEGQFDLSLIWSDSADGSSFAGVLSYNKDLFKPATIQRMAQHVEQLLYSIVAQPEVPLCTLSLLTDAERQQLQAWNNTATDYPQDQTIISLFEEQIARTPDNIAVVFEDASLTYAELNVRANQLAHTLIERGVQADTLVGICAERSLNMMVGLLAILKAGGAYVPLDPSYPAERLTFMLEDSQVQVLLTQTHLVDSLPLASLTTPPQLLCLDDQAIYAASAANPAPRSQPDNLAYVIYTSGSTGKPKGVALPHVALVNLLCWQQQVPGLATPAVTLQFTTLNFDVSFQEIFSTWCTGGQLLLIADDVRRDVKALLQYLINYRVERLFVPMVMLQHLAENFIPIEHHGLVLRDIITAGEQLRITPAVKRLFVHLPTCQLHNHYGPSESHVVTALVLPSSKPSWNDLPSIGQPIANTRIYLLDQHLQPLPPGIPGELCIAGAGLARGYLNRPELTAEKFVEVELFGKVERIYRTGDLARWLPDGNLEYLGRIDHQVKLRGFRIELGEIEAVLSQHPTVSTAAVVLHEREGNKSLAAYVVGAAVAASVDTAALRSWVAEQLPDYMIPASFTVLERMPLTPNGKVDRKALPEPDQLVGIAEQGGALRTSTEHLLAALWAGVLKLDVAALGADANFFALGGHSLLATQLAARVREAFEVELPLRVVLAQPMLAEMASWLDVQQRGDILPPLTAQPEHLPKRSSFAQQWFWLLNKLDSQASAHHILFAWQLKGHLDAAALHQAACALVERHQSLRLYFPDQHDSAQVAVLSAYDPWQFKDLSALTASDQAECLNTLVSEHERSVFDLTSGPLLRLQAIKLAEQQHVLLLNVHHIVFDAWSSTILFKEWFELYEAYKHQLVPSLPVLPIQYTDFAAWQQHYLQGDRLQRQLTYWQQQLGDAPTLLKLPLDYPRPAVQQNQGQQATLQLSKTLVDSLKQLALQHNCTLHMLLCSSFVLLLHRYSGQRDICIGIPKNNRTQQATENMVGLFLNMLTLRTRLSKEQTFLALLGQVRQQLLDAHAHGDVPFEMVLQHLNPPRSQSYNPYIQVMFNLVNVPESSSVTLDGLQVDPWMQAHHERAISNLDLVFLLQETPQGLEGLLSYDKALFKASTIEYWLDSFKLLLSQICEQVATPLQQFALSPNASYPLTAAQREIWFDQMLNPTLPLYNIGGYVKIKGTLDTALFAEACQLLVQKHDTLRTVLTLEHDEDGLPLQSISSLTIPFSLQDVAHEPDSHAAAMTWMQLRFEQPFSFNGEPLFRYDLVKLADEHYYWLMQYHHLITDGWGIALLNRSLADIYSQLVVGETPDLSSSSYVEFVHSDRAYVESATFQKDRAYWLAQFPCVPEPLLQSRYRSQFARHDTVGSGCEPLYLSRAFYQQLGELAKRHNASLFHVLLGALYVYFTRTAQRDDFAIGLPVLNRANARAKQTAGLFVGVSPTWFRFGTALSFAELLQQIGKTLKAHYRHQRFPVSEINREVGAVQGQSTLFDINFSYENHDYSAQFDDIETHTTLLLHSWSQTPLTIFVREFYQQAEVKFDFVYNRAYFQADDIRVLQTRFTTVLEAVLEQDQLPLKQLSFLTQTEQQQLQAWNNTATAYPQDQTITSLFEAQAARTPDNIAVVFENASLTYAELNVRANQLAHTLIERGVQADTLVGICAERSLDMIVGMLGILKAGGAYVPLDPAYPAERLTFMLEDSQVNVLLTQTYLVDSLPLTSLNAPPLLLCLDDQAVYAESAANPAPRSQPDNLAYVIYTSGSTGKPKGVMVEHKSLNNLCQWHQQAFAVTSSDRASQVANPAFDAATWEVWPYLLLGCRLYLASPDLQLQPELLNDWLKKNQITIAFLPTPLAEALLVLPSDNSSLRILLTGGDQLKLYPDPQQPFQVFNNYGPTESTVVATYAAVNAYVADDVPKSLPAIGQPVANTRIHLLDQQLKPLPLGIAGELCIAGAGLARGYLNQPALTAEKFLEVELFGQQERIYRTGDLARWLPDGNLEYLGRIDHQVKLRGFRIELGEIESVLMQHPSVSMATVVLHEKQGNKFLAAYVVGGASVDTATLRSWVAEQLPDYMIPASFTVLERMPLTPNGKVDRKALPEPESLTVAVEQGGALRTPTEHLLASLWAGVLKLDVAVCVANANFFNLGGHSLLATQLVARVREAFEVDLPLRMVFAEPTLRDMAAWLDVQQRGIAVPAIVPLPQAVMPPLSFAQQRLWFLAQLGDDATYNLPFGLRIEGKLDEPALRQAFQALVQRHDALRQYFPTVDGKAVVRLLLAYDPLAVTDLRHLTSETQQTEVQRLADADVTTVFDIARGPLMRLHLLILGEQSHVLLLNMHHIVSDGWSLGVFLQELGSLYRAYSTGSSANLPPLAVQYGDYAAWQRQWLQGEVLDAQRHYWAEQLAGIPALLALPTDFPRPAEQDYHGAAVRSCLDAALTARLQTLAQAQGCTLFMVLLAAFQTLLHRYSNQDDLCVGSPIANRAHAHTEELVGFFVNTLVLRARFQPDMSFTDLLKQVRHNALGAYAHQELPFEYLVEQINPQRSLSHTPLFQVMLSLQSPDSMRFDLAGIQAEPLAAAYPIAKFDLTLAMQETPEGLECYWEYATALFQADTIARMAGHLEVLLQAIVEQPATPLHRLPLLTVSEQQRLLVDWNANTTAYPREVCLHELFAEQAARTPDAIAVVCGAQQLTYQALSAQANYVAHNLLAQGVQPDTLVGICVERSLETSVALLGVLKAGAAYLPLDPNYPPERISYMLEHAQVKVVLTQSPLAQRFTQYSDLQVLHLDNMGLAEISADYAAPVTAVQPSHLAYVIYTSGSTGLPKGVMIPQRALVNRALALADSYALSAQDRVLQFAAFSFDVAAEEIFPTWLRGGCVVVAPRDCTHSVAELVSFVQQQQISVLNLPAPYWHEWVAQLSNHVVPACVRLVIAGSDKVLKTRLTRWQCQTAGRVPVYCGYGPTEATITATLYTEQNTQVGLTDSVLIGRPLPDTQTYILDQHQQPVPLGVPGELHLGGVALARGYLHAAELTAEKFIANPFQAGTDSRLYKTGDLVRYLPDGNIEFLGRIDEQVKIRGFRIELGEIAAVLRQHTAVQDAVVVAKDGANGHKQLVAYIVVGAKAQVIVHPALQGQTIPAATPQDDAQGLRRELRDFVHQHLPDYMIPAAFMLLDVLPLSPSGKLDTRALPEPDIQIAHGYVAPRTPTEQVVAGIWQAVLTVDSIGVLDNFFELGGHSLLITHLLHQVSQAFSVDLPVRSLFDFPTLEAFAEHIDHAREGLAGTVKAVDFHAEVWLDADLVPPTVDFKVEAQTLQAVFLTGATGFVGAFLLAELLQQTPAQIYCLVRAKDEAQGLQRLQQSLATHGLWQEHYPARLMVVLGDLGLPHFGLNEAEFTALAQQIDVIYHNGAWVNHVYPYSVLKAANVGGTQEAIRLACHSRTKPLHFISSLSVFAPEITEMYEDADLGFPELLENGYVETKWVADKIVSLAGQRGLPVTIHRVSGVAGMLANGEFTLVKDNFYRTVLTAVQLGMGLDSPLGEDNFLPADYACKAIVYLSSQRHLLGKTFHVGNPQNTRVDLTYQALRGLGYTIRMLAPRQWQAELLRLAKDDSEIGLHPLLSLFTTYDFTREPAQMLFDGRMVQAGLVGSGITCPVIDEQSLANYFAWLAQQGHLPLPSMGLRQLSASKRHNKV